MPINPDKLLAFSIPAGRQTFTAQDAAFYGLSIGLGQDPLDRRQLCYACQDLSDFRIFPTFSLVAAHPGFWLAHPESGVDAGAVLHANQRIEFVSPLPVGGLVTSRSRISRLVDKGPGKAAIFDTETLIEDEAGTLLARLLRTTFVRGGGGFGGTDHASDLPSPPDREPDHTVRISTRPEQALYYRLNGDLNPLHSDPAIAAKAGFDRPILHGLCTAGIVAHALARAVTDYNVDTLASIAMRFSGVVFPGETISTDIWSDGSFRARTLERGNIIVDNGMFRLRGDRT